MAIATQWVASSIAVATSSTSVYTTVAATVSSYLRDLVVTNSGAYPVCVSMGTSATAAVIASSFFLPPGGTVVLTQSQVPNAAKIYGIAVGTASSLSVGYATNVAYI